MSICFQMVADRHVSVWCFVPRAAFGSVAMGHLLLRCRQNLSLADKQGFQGHVLLARYTCEQRH